MSWTYSTNIMGPYGLWWYEKYKIPYTTIIMNNCYTGFKDVEYKDFEKWFGGRIDCHCDDTSDPDYDHFGQELSLPIMKAESLAKLDEFLRTYKSESFNTELLKTFEEQTGYKLILHKSEI